MGNFKQHRARVRVRFRVMVNARARVRVRVRAGAKARASVSVRSCGLWEASCACLFPALHVMSCWLLEVTHAGNILTMETGKF